MGGKRQRAYPPEFRVQALEQLRVSGQSADEFGKAIGVSGQTLRNWRAQAQADAHGGGSGPLTSAEREELVGLRKEVNRLRQERDFLKKASAFFARESSSTK